MHAVNRFWIGCRNIWCVAALLAGAMGAAAAQPANGGEHRGPPREALVACESKAAGTACSFTGRQGSAVTGTCWAPEGKPLACKPEHPPGEGGERRAPPR